MAAGVVTTTAAPAIAAMTMRLRTLRLSILRPTCAQGGTAAVGRRAGCGQSATRSSKPRRGRLAAAYETEELVGAAGFEPATTSPPDWCATRLRHAPTCRPSLTGPAEP